MFAEIQSEFFDQSHLFWPGPCLDVEKIKKGCIIASLSLLRDRDSNPDYQGQNLASYH